MIRFLQTAVLGFALMAPGLSWGDSHSCECSKDCQKACVKGKSKDCKCEHCDCAKGEGKCEKCHGKKEEAK